MQCLGLLPPVRDHSNMSISKAEGGWPRLLSPPREQTSLLLRASLFTSWNKSKLLNKAEEPAIGATVSCKTFYTNAATNVIMFHCSCGINMSSVIHSKDNLLIKQKNTVCN